MSRNPFYVVLMVSSDLLEAADDYLYRQGYGRGNVSRELIRMNDSNNATPKGYACMTQADASLVSILRKKAEQIGAKAQVFASIKRQTAKQDALAFLAGKGYRVRPRAAE